MAKSRFHDEPFDEATITKLEIFEAYLEEWLPVFIKKPLQGGIHIYDFFAGPGTDSEGTPGSPLRTISKVSEFSKLDGWGSTSVSLRYFDKKKKNTDLLKQNLRQYPPPDDVKCSVQRMEFKDSFKITLPELESTKSAKLLFIDQFGVKELTDEVFRKLTYLPTTDFLFFVASHALHRFAEHPVIQQKIKRPDDSYDIHRAAFEYYENLDKINPNVYLAPFTIKKGSNIYGLIFGSQHPLGMHKFLKIAWNKDRVSGQANFDIDRTDIREDAPFLLGFDEFEPTKKRKFEKDLVSAIRKGRIADEKELLLFCIRNGFTGQHAAPVLKSLKNDGVIDLRFRVPQESGLKTPRPLNLVITPS